MPVPSEQLPVPLPSERLPVPVPWVQPPTHSDWPSTRGGARRANQSFPDVRPGRGCWQAPRCQQQEPEPMQGLAPGAARVPARDARALLLTPGHGRFRPVPHGARRQVPPDAGRLPGPPAPPARRWAQAPPAGPRTVAASSAGASPECVCARVAAAAKPPAHGPVRRSGLVAGTPVPVLRDAPPAPAQRPDAPAQEPWCSRPDQSRSRWAVQRW